MTKEDIQKEYDQLAARTGDLFFVVDNLKAQLDDKMALMQRYKAERAKLQEALQKLSEVAVEPTNG